MIPLTGRVAEEVEEIILQGIGHVERRNILKIIGSAPEGVIYSEILNELQLNTGKLNYHLKLLEGLIERDAVRHYHLTKLGKKAVMILDSMTEDIGEEELNLVTRAKTSKDDFVTGTVNLWSRLVLFLSFTAFLGFVALFYTMIQVGEADNTVYIWLIIPAAILILGYFWLEKVKREAPERISEFLNRFRKF